MAGGAQRIDRPPYRGKRTAKELFAQDDFSIEFHIDVDEVHAGNTKNGEFVELLQG